MKGEILKGKTWNETSTTLQTSSHFGKYLHNYFLEKNCKLANCNLYQHPHFGFNGRGYLLEPFKKNEQNEFESCDIKNATTFFCWC
jgi:hypothetical protein